MIQKKIKFLIDEFLNFEFEDLLQKGSKLNSKLIKEIKVKNNFDPLKFTDEFNQKFDKIFPVEINNEYRKIREIKNTYKSFQEFKKNKKIRILFIGKISTGKTSLLNSIIGTNEKILDTSAKECTQSIFIIKNSNDISFCESNFIKNEFGNYFEDIKDTRINNINIIKNKIKEINKENNRKIKYYSLYIPIEAFKIGNKKIKEFDSINIKDIELIDIPGFKDTNFKNQKYLKDLINLCDGFIFNFNGKSILEDKDSQDFILNIINYIKEKDDSFNFNNCLFNLNYFDFFKKKNEINETVQYFKEKLYNILNGNIYKCDLIEKLKLKEKIKESQNIHVSYFSNLKYSLFQKNIYDLNNICFLEHSKNIKLKEIYSNLKEDYDDIPILENIDENRINEKINAILKKINKKDLTNKEKLLIRDISILILSILENKEQLNKYKLSYADIFFTKFKEQIIFAEKNNKEFIIHKSLSYIIYTLFKLYYIDNLCSNDNIINDNKKKINKKKTYIEEECQKYINNINNDFSSLLEENIKDIEKDIIQKANKQGNLSKYGINQIIEGNKTIEQISNLIENIKKEKMEQLKSYGEYCINQCSNLIEEGNLEIISRIVLLNFAEKYKDQNQPYYNLLQLSFKTTIEFLKLNLKFYGFFISIPYEIYQRFKANEKKISDIFDKIKKIINDIKNKIILEFKNQRDNFISNLSDIEQITEEEISFLKRNDFQHNFKELINFVKENNSSSKN